MQPNVSSNAAHKVIFFHQPVRKPRLLNYEKVNQAVDKVSQVLGTEKKNVSSSSKKCEASTSLCQYAYSLMDS